MPTSSPTDLHTHLEEVVSFFNLEISVLNLGIGSVAEQKVLVIDYIDFCWY